MGGTAGPTPEELEAAQRADMMDNPELYSSEELEGMGLDPSGEPITPPHYNPDQHGGEVYSEAPNGETEVTPVSANASTSAENPPKYEPQDMPRSGEATPPEDPVFDTPMEGDLEGMPVESPPKYDPPPQKSPSGEGGAEASGDFGTFDPIGPSGTDHSFPIDQSFEVFKNSTSELFTGAGNFFEPVITMMSDLWANTATTFVQAGQAPEMFGTFMSDILANTDVLIFALKGTAAAFGAPII